MREREFMEKVIGLRVITRPDGHRDFTPRARLTRRESTGTITGFHNSHGQCFDVRHDDGTESCYDLDEIELCGPDTE